MAIYLKKFETTVQYDAAKPNLILPNVSLITETNGVEYNPFDPCVSQKVQTTYDWVEIGGIKWATKNVGALTETDYGQKFSWGGVSGYTNDQVIGSCKSKGFIWADYEHGTINNFTKYNTTDGRTVLQAVDDAATVNMGAEWRMPTEAELNALIDATNKTWVSRNGVNGELFTSKSDSSKTLFFPAAGYCNGSSRTYEVGYGGYYWLSSIRVDNYRMSGQDLYFAQGSCYKSNTQRCEGLSVRGVYIGQ